MKVDVINQNLLKVIISLLCILAASFVSYNAYRSISASDALKEKIQQTLSRSGIGIEFESIDVEFPKISLEAVSVSHILPFDIARISANLDFDFDEFDWKVKQVELEGIKGKYSDDHLRKVFLKLSSGKGSPGSRMGELRKIQEITVKNSSITLAPSILKKKPINLQGINGSYDPALKFLQLKISRVKFGPAVTLKDVFLEIKRHKPSKWSFLIYPGANSQINHWHIKGHLDPKNKKLFSFVKLRGLPSSVAKHVNGYLDNSSSILTAAKIQLSLSNKLLKFSVKSGFANMTLKHRTLSPSSVGPLPLRIDFKGHYHHQNKTVRVSSGRFALSEPLKKVKGQRASSQVNWKATITNAFKKNRPAIFDVKMTMPETRCQTIQKTIPKGFLKSINEFRIDGHAGFDLEFKFSSANPSQFKYLLDHEFDCRVLKSSKRFQASHILQSIRNRQTSTPISVRQSGQGFTDVDTISHFLIQTFLAFEDGGFYIHKGIQKSSIEQALRTNLEKGRIRLGGSTITMQTVKNLFLSHARTIDRKLQELFLTWHLERILTKKQILEIYTNIIEFGPGIYGISKASETYFNKIPLELSLLESAYLASVLPNPVARFKNFCRGWISDSYRNMLNRKLKLMHEHHRISETELRIATESQLRFKSGQNHPYCRHLASRSTNQQQY